MSIELDISSASLNRKIATGCAIAKIAASINACFILLAVIEGIWVRVFILFVLQLGLLLSIFLFNTKRYQWHTPWIFVATVWLSILAAVLTNGGGIQNVIVLWLAMLVSIAGLVGSHRFAVQWFMIALVTAFGVWALELLSVAVPNMTPEPKRYALAVLHVFAQLVCAGGLVSSYRAQLKKYEGQVADIIDLLKTEVDQREHAERMALKISAEKDQFLRNVSHEFRTPLNSIIGFSERLLKKHSDNKDIISPLMAINRNGRGLHYFVSELLMLDAVVATPLDISNSRPAQTLHEVMIAVEVEASRFGISFDSDIDPACFAVVAPIDVARLSLAMSNLLLFAVRQSPPGVIVVKACLNQHFMDITITDCAPILSEIQLSNLFEMHYDLVLNNEKDIPSSAFSLKIAAVIIARHHGILSAKAVVPTGNQITLRLPLASEQVTA